VNIKMNDMARVRLRITRPLVYDGYRKNRITGSLILIDDTTNETVAAGTILS
jgi:sulfate adenylyltransferase subunit 1